MPQHQAELASLSWLDKKENRERKIKRRRGIHSGTKMILGQLVNCGFHLVLNLFMNTHKLGTTVNKIC